MMKRPVDLGDGYNDLVAKLKLMREQQRLSQKALDHIIGVTDGVVSKWETHSRRPTSHLLSCWVTALGGKLTIDDEDKEETTG